jgi:hypothetical protein
MEKNMIILRAIVKAIHSVSPDLYHLMKSAAYARHGVFKEFIEKDDRPLKDTWHQKTLDSLYKE